MGRFESDTLLFLLAFLSFNIIHSLLCTFFLSRVYMGGIDCMCVARWRLLSFFVFFFLVHSCAFLFSFLSVMVIIPLGWGVIPCVYIYLYVYLSLSIFFISSSIPDSFIRSSVTTSFSVVLFILIIVCGSMALLLFLPPHLAIEIFTYLPGKPNTHRKRKSTIRLYLHSYIVHR